MKRYLFGLLLIFQVHCVFPQEPGLQMAIREMTKEPDPIKCIAQKDQIISKYQLNRSKDAEIIDMLNGSVAIAFLRNKQYPEFEGYIDSVKSKFNQTSMMNMAVSELLQKNADAAYANKVAKQTLERYEAFKDDPVAKPEAISAEDWARFMEFAKYPYYDAYAHSFYALENYKEALRYQTLAFDGLPEEGIPSSVARYAKLLELNGQKEEAKQLLIKVAGLGKLNQEMISQLESFYIAENGSRDNFDSYLADLMNESNDKLREELKKKMLNEVAPGFTLNNLEGKQVSLKDYKGKIVVIDLWATWCAPCIASFPAMEKEVTKHPEVEFLFIAVDERGPNIPEKVQRFMAKHKYPFHVLIDEPVEAGSRKFKITSTYQPNGIPAKYFIDRNGILRFKTKGFDTDTQLINEVDAIISILSDL